MAEPADSVEVDRALMETLRRFEAAHALGSRPQMRACFHDDALIESVASDGRSLGPDETADALERALGDTIYSIGDWRYEEISPGIVLSITSARRLRIGSGMTDAVVYRLISGRDGLMWRVKIFDSRAQALDHLALYGAGLGL